MFYILSDGFLACVSLAAILICCFGIIGNVLNVYIFVQKPLRSPTSLVAIGLAIFDSILLFALIALYGISYQFHYYFPHIDYTSIDIYTSLVYPIKRTAYSASVYATVLISAERYIAECYPTFARRILTTKTVGISLAAVGTFATLINIPRWFEHDIVESKDEDGNLLAITLLEHEDYLLYYEELLWSTSMYIIPFFFILVTNICIWKKQLLQRQRDPTREQIVPPDIIERRRTKMLLTVASVFFMLNALNCIFVVFYISVVGWKSITSETLGNLPIVINSSIKFVIYSTMSLKFRVQLRRIYRHVLNRISCCRKGPPITSLVSRSDSDGNFTLEESNSQHM